MTRPRRSAPTLLAAAFGGLAAVTLTTAAAAAPEGRGLDGIGPVLWSWQDPLGAAAEDGRFIRFVRIRTHHAPEAAADAAIAEIRERGLVEGEIAIILQNFGMGHGDPTDKHDEGPALFCHWGDALPHRARPESDPTIEQLASNDANARWWDTPWMSHGIDESRGWMARFLERYVERQAADPSIPSPARFHFDSEEHPIASRKTTPSIFKAMQMDPRWNTERIPGFGNKTLAQLWAESGIDSLSPTRFYYQGPNREWAAWYESLLLTAVDAAMDEVAYQLVRDAFPRALSSNYGTSAHYDGADDRRDRPTDRAAWYSVRNTPSGDIQAPVFYIPGSTWREAGETAGDGAVRWAREHLHANLFSGAGPNDRIAPWTLVPGQTVGRAGNRATADERMLLEMLTLYRSAGIREVLLWSGPQTQSNGDGWNQLDRALAGAWSMRLDGARMTVGTATGRSLARLRRAWDDHVTVTSDRADLGHRAILVTDWTVSDELDDARSFRVDVGIDGAPSDLDVQVVLVDPATGQRWLPERGEELEPGVMRSHIDADRRSLQPGEQFQVHVEFNSPRAFVAEVDLVLVSVDAIPVPGSAEPAPRRRTAGPNDRPVKVGFVGKKPALASEGGRKHR